MTETVRELIARLSAEIGSEDGWMELELTDVGACLVGGAVQCRSDVVEFDDDSGLHAVVPYERVRAIRIGQQGRYGHGLRSFVVDTDIDAPWRMAG